MLHPVSSSTAKVRSRRGCLTCRLRKVKCDENAGRCQNCIRLRLECSWPTISSYQNRKKYRKACERCRRKKLKCGLTDGVQQCDHCTLAETECIKSDSIGPLQQPPSLIQMTSPSQQSVSQLPPRSEVIRILQAYFDGPHYFCFYTFIHPPTFMQMLNNDLIPRCLLLIVLATGLRCLDPESALPDDWAEECRRLVIPDIFSRASTTNLQTLLLLQRYEWHRGAHLSAYFVATLATRLATALQLEAEPSSNRSNGPPLPVTVMETRRRLIWSCFTMDSVPDGSTRPLRSALDPFSIEARLPCDERSYWLGLDSVTDTFSNIKECSPSTFKGRFGSSSIAGYIIQMAVIRLQVLQYASIFSPKNKELLLPEIPWQLDSKFHYHKRLLDDFITGIPPGFQWNNLERSSDAWQSTRSTLCTLHVMYHAAYNDLLRVALFLERAQIVLQNNRSCEENSSCRQPIAGFHQSTEFRAFLQSCQRSRLQHAYDITTIIANSLFANLSYQDLDPFVSVGACVSIRVLILERGPGDAESLGISETAIQNALDVATTCAKMTARWSQPMRKMLHALAERALQCGFRLDVPEVLLPRTSSPTSHIPSRAQSPSLRTYGTQGSIHRSLASHKDDTQIFLDQQSNVSMGHEAVAPGKGNNLQESTVAATIPHPHQRPAIPTESILSLEPSTTGIAGTSIPDTTNSGEQGLNSPFLHSYEALSPESLRIASNWGNGTYDIVSNDLSFVMGPGDTFLDFNGDDYPLFSTEIGNNNIWPAL